MARTSVPSAALPELDSPSLPAGGKQRSVGRHGKRHDTGCPAAARPRGMAISVRRRHIPEPDAVVGGRRDEPRCRRRRRRACWICQESASSFVERLPTGRVRVVAPPEIDEPVLRRRPPGSAIRREGEVVDRVFRRLERGLDLAGREIEQADIAVGRLVAEPGAEIAAGGDRLAVGRNRDGEDLAVVARADDSRAACAASRPLCQSQMRIVLSSEAETRYWPSRREGDVLDEGAMAAGVEVEMEIRRLGSAPACASHDQQRQHDRDPQQSARGSSSGAGSRHALLCRRSPPGCPAYIFLDRLGVGRRAGLALLLDIAGK